MKYDCSPVHKAPAILIFGLFAAVHFSCPLLFGQADGVAIAEQSKKGLGREDDRIISEIQALEAQGKLLEKKVLQEQLKHPVGGQFELPRAHNERLTPSEVADRARVSTLRVGWAYLCENCGKRHLSLSGGYAVSADGVVVTCAHVLKAPKMKAGSLVVVDCDKKVYPVTAVLANDVKMDTAIIKVDANLQPLPLNDQVRPGDSAYCYSDPLKQRGYFSSGIVNRFYWNRSDPDRDERSIKALRALRLNVSVPWAPGSSGAPILDQCGNAIGHVAEIDPMGRGGAHAHQDLKSNATIDDLKHSIPLITLHIAIPARSVLSLAKSGQPRQSDSQ